MFSNATKFVKKRASVDLSSASRFSFDSLKFRYTVMSKLLDDKSSFQGQCRSKCRGCFFFVKDRNLFQRVDTIGNIFTSGGVTSENTTDGVHEMK